MAAISMKEEMYLWKPPESTTSSILQIDDSRWLVQRGGTVVPKQILQLVEVCWNRVKNNWS